MKRLRKIDPVSASVHIGAAMAAIGLLLGLVYAVSGFFVDLFSVGLNISTLIAFSAIIGMPVTFGTGGVIWGAVAASIYNLAASRLGGMVMAWED